MAFVVLDTDVASDLFADKPPPSVRRLLVGQTPCVTFATVGELLAWPEVGRWTLRKRRALDDWLDGAVLRLPYDGEVARTWGRIQGQAMARGRQRPQNDTWIAAVCLVRRLPLLTYNQADFADYVKHEELRLL
ncbi:MAG: PIN domain-containing protein [Mycobacteriales bacterium]